MKKIIIILVVLALAAAGIYYFNKSSAPAPVAQNENTDQNKPAPAPEPTPKPENGAETVIGKSVDGKNISAYTYGSGDKKILFVGGIHGGYAWNTTQLAYQTMDYLKANPSAVPANVSVVVIPVLNPDGLNKVVPTDVPFKAPSANVSATTLAAGRFNSHTVDLNRNFDCDWQASGKWQNKTVSGGTAAFSEPETLAFKNFVEASKPVAVVAWYSSGGGVYASNCHGGVSSDTNKLTKTYADASGYAAHQDFNFYEITGDMTNWLAKINVPAIGILLTTHTDTEWSKNQKGIDAVLSYYGK